MTHACPTRRSSDLPVDEGALGAERRAARIAEYAVEVAALGHKLRIGIEDVVGAQRERPAITVVINGRVEDPFGRVDVVVEIARSEEHTSELQSLMRSSYAVFCLKKNKKITN